MKKALFNPCFSPQVISFTSDHSLDFSLKSNHQDQALNSEQVEYVQQNCQLPQIQYINIRQVHGNGIVCVGQDYMSNNVGIEEADGLLTTVPQHALLLRTADCLPVFLFDVFAHCIGIIHAGWRGVDKEIAAKTVKKLEKEFDCKATDLIIAFGPAALKDSYIKGNPSQKSLPKWEAFLEKINDSKYKIDFVGFCKQQLIKAGVKKENLFESGVDTIKDSRFYSHYRDSKTQSGDKGRFACVVGIR